MIRVGTLDWGREEREALCELVSEENPQLTLGKYCAQFEDEFAKYIGTRYAIFVNSGTSALFLALRSVKILSSLLYGHVVTTSLTYMATYNAIISNGFDPYPIDIEPNSLNMDLKSISNGIIIPVHLMGKPVRRLREWAVKHVDSIIIEDAAQAIGSKLGNKRLGSIGLVAAFSFFPAHQITTIEGGMITTNDEKIAEICRALRDNSRVCTCPVCTLKTKGICKKREGYTGEIRWAIYDYAGFNMKPTEIQGLLGHLKMKKIDRIVERRHQIFKAYSEEFEPTNISALQEEKGEYICPLAFPIIVPNRQDRQEVINKLHKAGVEARGMYPSRGDCKNAEAASRRCLFLPAHQNLSDEDVKHVIGCMKNAIKD